MALIYSVDLISDLNLGKTDQFDWTGKPTSLFCIVAGNVSPDYNKVKEVLEHLGSIYRGVFYIDGNLEHPDLTLYEENIKRLTEICKPITNVIYMHNHVIIVNEVAFVGANGWFGKDFEALDEAERLKLDSIQNEDLAYLSNTLRNLQLHRDAKKIVIISNSIPSEHLLYNSNQPEDLHGVEPGLSLIMDTDHKVSHWLYGGTSIVGDLWHDNRRYVNNPMVDGQPYWPKRITI